MLTSIAVASGRKKHVAIEKDMEQVHKEVGLPLKATWTSEQTKERVVKRLGLEDTGCFGLLGFLWNLVKSMIQPQDYLNMFGKVRKNQWTF